MTIYYTYGSIRLIYQGISTDTPGEGTQIRTSAFNSTYSNNMYVGYMYMINQVHGPKTVTYYAIYSRMYNSVTPSFGWLYLWVTALPLIRS